MSETKRSQPVAPVRRIITSHSPTDTDGNDVTIFDDSKPLLPVLGGGVCITSLYSHPTGTPNTHTITPRIIDAQVDEVKGVVRPGGVNLNYTDLAPGFLVPYHRTSSVDYNIILQGSAVLITPTPDGGEKRTIVGKGDIVVQRGTLHAWEAGPEGARWVSVLVSAGPVTVGDDEGGKVLDDVDF